MREEKRERSKTVEAERENKIEQSYKEIERERQERLPGPAMMAPPC